MGNSQNYIIGGSGDCGNSSLTNGGMYAIKDAPYTGAWADLMAANGGPIYNYKELTTFDGSVTITRTSGDFTNAAVGMFVYVYLITDEVGAWVQIDGVDAIDQAYIEVMSLDAYDAQDVEVRVGGAWPANHTGIQQALDVIVAGETIEICCNQDTGTTMIIGAALNTNVANDGGPSDLLQMKGVDSADGTDLDSTSKYPVLQASANMASILQTQSQFWRIGRLHFDGNGKTFTVAGVQATDTLNSFYNCLCSNVVGKDGFYSHSVGNVFADCEAWDCGRFGFYCDTYGDSLISCSAHECGSNGINMYGGYGSGVINCRAYHNTGSGIVVRSYGGVCAGNVADANTACGFYFTSWPYMTAVYNNSATNNIEQGYFAQTSTVKSFAMFAGNHSYGNSAHSNMCADGAWADLFGGGNITGDPLFRGDETDGDYRLQAGSPLLNAGWPQTWGYETDQDAISIFNTIGVPSTKQMFNLIGGN